MLVKLYDLPTSFDFVGRLAEQGVTIRKPIGPDALRVQRWVAATFGDGWASEFGVTVGRHPFTSFIAVEAEELVGFACYDATARGFFGPIGVREDRRRKGIGAALILACLQDMKLQGYGYAIVGAVGPADFYTRVCGAVPIPDSSPGIYAGRFHEKSE
ncbi:GNAT family N-acetyltransferase [bacterium]|nr:GNAT family N-acetyltransferase [bacterium]